MSWVAEEKATISAKSARWVRSSMGSLPAIPKMAAISKSWENSIQPRRRPKSWLNKGRGMRSTRGDQAHLKA